MLTRETIINLAKNYESEKGWAEEERLFSGGFHDPILFRHYLEKDEFLEIVRWKSPRPIKQADRNNSTDLEMVSRLAFQADDPGLATHILCYLHGVQVRMASAILTVYNPCLYTVMDINVNHVINDCFSERKFDFAIKNLDDCSKYPIYLQFCRELAKDYDVSLRTLDRALWMKGKYPNI